MCAFHTWLTPAIVLSLPMLGNARVAQHKLDTGLQAADWDEPTVEFDAPHRGWSIKNFFRKRQTELDCSFPNSYYRILNTTRGEEEVRFFCNRWLAIPPKLEQVVVTPTM